jgi:hypothetical protein
MNSAKLASLLGQLPLIVISLIVIYCSVHFGTSSLYQIGLENEIDQYTDFMFNADVNDPQFEAQAQTQRDTIDDIAANLLEMNPSNPEVVALLAYIATSHYWDGDETNQSLSRARELHQMASHLRPIYSDTYAEQAYNLVYQNQPFELVIEQLELAQRFGPFEASTARAAIDILFAHWPALSGAQRLQAMQYVTKYELYGLHRLDLNHLIETSLQKEKLCNVARFVQLDLRTCH